MVDIHEALSKKKEQNRRFEPRREFVPAFLRSVSGSVAVPGRPGYVWAQEAGDDGSVFQVLNLATANVDGLAVIIGRSLTPPFRRGVVGVDTSSLADLPDYTGEPYLTEHAASHQYPEGNPGSDPVLVYQPALQPLKCTPYSGWTVAVQGLIYRVAGRVVRFSGGQVDLSSYVPASGQKRAALVYLDAETNALQVTAGVAVTDVPSVSAPSPDVPVLAIAAAYVVLTGGAAGVSAADVIDARSLLPVRDDRRVLSNDGFILVNNDNDFLIPG